MTDEGALKPASAGGPVRPVYEKPKLIHLGNARELLAGASGTIADVPQVDPTDTRPSH
jgi:hypothetical protein